MNLSNPLFRETVWKKNVFRQKTPGSHAVIHDSPNNLVTGHMLLFQCTNITFGSQSVRGNWICWHINMEAVKFTPGSSAYPFIFSEQCESSNGGCRKNKTNKKITRI